MRLWFRRKDSNLRKRNQKPGASVSTGFDDAQPAENAVAVESTHGPSKLDDPRSVAASDQVAEALARALDAASAAGRFDVVAELAAELKARRIEAAGNVVELAKRRTRGR